MAYYKKVLQPGETVHYIGRLHWSIYRYAMLFGVLTLAAAALTVLAPELLPDRAPGETQHLGLIAVVVLAVLTFVFFFPPWFERMTTEVVVTDKRIIHKTGWISRRTQEMNITKVETVDVEQSIGGRIFGFGTVLIKGIGGSWEPLRRLAAPLQLRNAILVS